MWMATCFIISVLLHREPSVFSFDDIFDRSLIITISIHFKAIYLDFVHIKSHGHFNVLYPAVDGLAGIAVNKFDIELIAILSVKLQWNPAPL